MTEDDAAAARTAALRERLRVAREAKAAKVAAEQELEQSVDADLIPDNPYDGTESQIDTELDRMIHGLDIVDVYNKYSHKTPVRPRASQRESIKVSCPNPAHGDTNPSAWMNRDKNTWYCGPCDQGGDVLDIFAWHFGFPVPGYKKESYPKLKEEIALEYGYTLHKIAGTKQYALAKEEQEKEEDTEEPEKPKPDITLKQIEEEEAKVVNLFGMPLEKFDYPSLDWKELLPEDTFLREYMEQCSKDDVAEEYHFWNGLLAIGFALGRNVTLWDDIPIFGNLFICLLGKTGDGKSKSFRHLEGLLQRALPYKKDDETSKGVHFIRSPASAESLIHQFSKPVMDPTNPKVVAYYAGVNGLVEYNELAALMGRANRGGNVIKSNLIEFYDAKPIISSSSITSGEKMARDAFASFHTTSQPRVLKDLLSQGDADAGLLNRWVFVSGEEKIRYSLGGVKIDTTPSIPYLHEIRSWAAKSREIELEEDAAERWDVVFKTVVKKHQQEDETDMLTRVDLLLKKLFLLFCANELKEKVTLDIVERVIQMYPYIMKMYGITSSRIGNSIKQEIEEDIIRIAKKLTEKNPAGMTMRDLSRALASKKYDKELINRVIDILVKAEILSESISQKGKVGRPTKRFSYVA